MQLALLLTLLVSLFFLVGMIIPLFIKDKNKMIKFSTGLAFTIILFLLLLDLIPELVEILDELNNNSYIFVVLIFIIVGILLLKILDFFIPEHNHNHHENEKNVKEHNNHFYHIGIITSISLIIHNILEGISIYLTGLTNIKVGLIMAISVGLHNLPLGIDISANMNLDKENKKSKYLIAILLVLSSCIGALLISLFGISLAKLSECIMISLTIGMLIYISLFEILKEVVENIKDKYTRFGLIVGIILIIILSIL